MNPLQIHKYTEYKGVILGVLVSQTTLHTQLKSLGCRWNGHLTLHGFKKGWIFPLYKWDQISLFVNSYNRNLLLDATPLPLDLD